MATFAYTARDAAGRVLRGNRVAGDPLELRRALRSEGAFLVRAKKRRAVTASGRMQRAKPRDLILFTFNLQNLVEAGVPLMAGLEDMRDETKDPGFRRVIGEVIDGVSGGETLAQALAHHPGIFDSLYVNMIDAGEQSGRLPMVLERILQLLEWNEEFTRRVRDLVMYPAVLLVAMVGLVALVIGFVFPRFADIFRRVSFELPLPTRILMATSDFFSQWWLALAIGVAAVWGAAVVVGRIPRVRLFVHGVWMKLPVVGELVVMLNFSLVARTLGSFVDAGIGIPHALEMIAQIVPNRRIGLSIKQAKDAILGGETLSGALRETGVFPPLIMRMVRMGEQSGRLVEALGKAGSIYDREVPVMTKRVLGLLNPALTVVIGGMLMFVILSVMMPLYGMYQQIGSSY